MNNKVLLLKVLFSNLVLGEKAASGTAMARKYHLTIFFGSKLRALITVVAVALLAACSGGSSSGCGQSGSVVGGAGSGGAGGSGSSGGSSTPQLVLISGDQATAAITQLPELEESETPDSAFDESNGILLDKISIIIADGATTQQVNDVLTKYQLSLSGSSPGDRFVIVSPVSSVSFAEIQTLTDQLGNESAIELAAAVFEDDEELVPPEGPTLQGIDHFKQTRFPALWNLRDFFLMDPNRPRVSVLVYDTFSTAPNLSGFVGSVRVVPGGLPDCAMTSTRLERRSCDHGIGVASIIASNWDSSGVTPAHPAPEFLDTILLSRPAGKVSARAHLKSIADTLRQELARASAPANGRMIVNFSRGYSKRFRMSGGSASWEKMQSDALSLEAFYWMNITRAFADKVVFVASTGNIGALSNTYDVRYNNVFTWIRDADETCLQSSLSRNENAFCDNYIATGFESSNILNVGSTDDSRATSDPSKSGLIDVSAVGENIPIPCVSAIAADGCSSGFRTASGNSYSVPQVAALAATLWGLAPDATADEIAMISKVSNRGSTEILDAYGAAMAVDALEAKRLGLFPDAVDFPDRLEALPDYAIVRRAILDVADRQGNLTPDGSFDRFDLAYWFKEAYRVIDDNADPDHSRFDIDGNGYSGLLEQERATNRPHAGFRFPFSLVEYDEDDLQIKTGGFIHTFGSKFLDPVFSCDLFYSTRCTFVGAQNDFKMLSESVMDPHVLCFYGYKSGITRQNTGFASPAPSPEDAEFSKFYFQAMLGVHIDLCGPSATTNWSFLRTLSRGENALGPFTEVKSADPHPRAGQSDPTLCAAPLAAVNFSEPSNAIIYRGSGAVGSSRNSNLKSCFPYILLSDNEITHVSSGSQFDVGSQSGVKFSNITSLRLSGLSLQRKSTRCVQGSNGVVRCGCYENTLGRTSCNAAENPSINYVQVATGEISMGPFFAWRCVQYTSSSGRQFYHSLRYNEERDGFVDNSGLASGYHCENMQMEGMDFTYPLDVSSLGFDGPYDRR